jgi:hypothetical protein
MEEVKIVAVPGPDFSSIQIVSTPVIYEVQVEAVPE